ncbi:MAG: right-handed parallel beta-helix repeat-containing protein [candidate division Zixibacteria bacterium]|nr:right-handed parallel beta-helix repeat-containing protein [candidate division Zixibacteria bacterium]
MKNIILSNSVATFLLAFFVLLTAEGTNARVEVSGLIAKDTVWTNDDTILVTGFVTVADTGRLLIEVGTVVTFRPAIRIMVFGNMTAIGTENNPIYFTSAADTAGGEPKPGDWYGLDFQVNSTGELKFCHIRYPIIGTYVYCAAVTFSDCRVEDFLLYGLQINGGSLEVPIITFIESCTVQQTLSAVVGTGVGIFAYQSAALDLSRTYINQCEVGLDIYSFNTNIPSFEVTSCDIRNNALYGVHIRSGG